MRNKQITMEEGNETYNSFNRGNSPVDKRSVQSDFAHLRLCVPSPVSAGDICYPGTRAFIPCLFCVRVEGYPTAKESWIKI